MKRALVLLVCLVVPMGLFAEDKKPETRFLRIVREDGQPVALETAIAHYVSGEGEKGVQVDLVAVVHIGDKGYYRKLNKQFEQYDAVLYELVAPEGTKVPKGGKKDSDNPLAKMQQIMKMALRLEHQLEQVDYTKKNFIHADLSPEGMKKAMAERGDDQMTVMLGVVADMMRKKNMQEQKPQVVQVPNLELADILNPTKIKRVMAQQFENMDDPNGGLGKTINQILVEDRNKACLKVFQQQVTGGKKKIAIFYGAAHMPDFDKRLKEDFGLRRMGEEWLQAWSLD
jgi:hypothetical protein